MLNYRDNLVFLLAKAHQQAQGDLKAQLKAFGLTSVQCLVLESLWEEDGLRAGDIGRRLILDTATLSGVLDRMVTAGWIRREVDTEDARVARVYLTAKARERTVDLAAVVESVNNALLTDFSLEEKLLFKRFLRALPTAT